MAEKKLNETVQNRLLPYAEAVRRFPVRIGAPSYVWPGGYSYNVEMLSHIFSEIQILVLEDFDTSPIEKGEIESLLKIAGKGLNYSLHLPTHTGLTGNSGGASLDGSSDASLDAVAPIVKIIKAFKPLNVSNYVLHIDNPDAVDAKTLSRRLLAIADNGGIAIEELCIENLDGRFEKIWERVGTTGVSICCDVGHLLYRGEDPIAFIDKYEKNIRMAHIHGAGEKDHISLLAVEPSVLAEIFSRFVEMDMLGPVIIENYSVDDMLKSLGVLDSLIREGAVSGCPA